MLNLSKCLFGAAAVVVAVLLSAGCSERSTVPESSIPNVDQARELYALSELEVDSLSGVTFEFYSTPGVPGVRMLAFQNQDSCLVLELSPAGELVAHSAISKGMWDCITRNGAICRQLYPDDSVPGAAEAYNRCYAKGLTFCVVAYSVMSWFVDES